MSQSIAGEGLAVTDEMAQMAADAGLCPGCGGTVRAEDTNCAVCMQKLAVPAWLKKKRQEEAQAKAKKEAPAPKAEKKCPSCGEEIDPDFITCPSCGKQL
jgi:predicted amidophosphoribosyltransferase